MPRYFDIIPPTKKKNAEPKRKAMTQTKVKSDFKREGTWLLFVILILCATAISLLAVSIKNMNKVATSTKTSNQTTLTIKPTTSPVPISTVSESAIKDINCVRIINASTDTAAIDKVKKDLTENSFNVEQTGSVTNRFPETVIYYRGGQLKEAQKIQSVTPEFKSHTEESQTLSDTYDFLMIIGEAKS